MAKPERPRRGILLLLGVGIAVVSYVALAACGSNQPDASSPKEPLEAGPFEDPQVNGIGDASTGGSSATPATTTTTAPSASALKPYTDPMGSAKPPPKPTATTTHSPSGTFSPPPTHTPSDSPPPGRHH